MCCSEGHFSWSSVELIIKEMHGRVHELIDFKKKKMHNCKKNDSMNISAIEWKCRFLLFGLFIMVILVCRKEKLKYPQQNKITFIYQSYSKGEKAMSHYDQTKNKYDAKNSR